MVENIVLKFIKKDNKPIAFVCRDKNGTLKQSWNSFEYRKPVFVPQNLVDRITDFSKSYKCEIITSSISHDFYIIKSINK